MNDDALRVREASLEVEQGDLVALDGYVQLATTAASPPAADCDDPAEHGRMKVDPKGGASAQLWICVSDRGAGGMWVSK